MNISKYSSVLTNVMKGPWGRANRWCHWVWPRPARRRTWRKATGPAQPWGGRSPAALTP